MAGLFTPGGLLGPLGPGMSPVVNPLAFIGAGMASGNVGGALAQMAGLQQQAQTLALERARQEQAMAAERQKMEMTRQAMAQTIAQQNAAKLLAGRMFPAAQRVAGEPTEAGEAPMTAGHPMHQAAMLAAGMDPAAFGQAFIEQTGIFGAPEQTNPEKIYAALGGQAGTGKTLAEWYATDYKGGGTTVQIGGSEFGATPAGMARIPDATSPTGTRLVEQPGSPGEAKREAAVQAKLAPLDSMQDSLNRYRAMLEKTGPEITGRAVLGLDTAYTDLLMQAKEAANLGALTGPDLELIERMIVNPTSLRAQYYEKTGRAGMMLEQLNTIQQSINDARARAEGREPEPPKVRHTQDNPALIVNDAEYDNLEPGDYYTGPDGVLRVK